ncbi:MAG: hypothetical protein KAR30_00730 [Gammaproteobacteria bacterium]|nr:hypothetical protein [Gammaproteobacteria bacterium]
MQIYCPSQLDDIEAVNFLQQLYHYKDDEELCTNYSQLRFSYPFATLLVAIGVRNLIRYRYNKKLNTSSRGHKKSTSGLTYLKHFGFFKFIGLNEGKKPNQAPGNGRYIPIKRLNENDFIFEGLRLQEGIDRECIRLAKIIYSGKANESRAHMLSYCLREIIRNVFEHAEINECFMMAQKWSNGFAEIAIADQGIGLSESLSNSHDVKDARDAINLAIQPGISSDDSEENDDAWQNTGFGLFVVSQLGSQLGIFALGSDNTILFSDKENTLWNTVPINGTAVKLRVNTNDAEYFPNILQRIVDDGERKAQEISGAKKRASKKSSMADIIW